MITIRKLTIGESGCIHVINNLLQQLKPGMTVLSEEEFKAMLNDAEHYQLFIAEDDAKKGSDAIIGMTSVIWFRKLSGARIEIHDVVVDEGYRGQGVGEALMRSAIEYAQQWANKFKKEITIHLTSKPDRVAGNALYKKLEFALVASAMEVGGTNLYQKKISPSL